MGKKEVVATSWRKTVGLPHSFPSNRRLGFCWVLIGFYWVVLRWFGQMDLEFWLIVEFWTNLSSLGRIDFVGFICC